MSSGAFEGALALPTEVIADKARAEFENGVLIITLSKAEEVCPRAIGIKTRGCRNNKKEPSAPTRFLML